MSSHHIVKEGQEPALIIANGQPSSFALLSQLLEWNPLIVVLDGALRQVLDLGIKFDVVLGDFDHMDLEEIRAMIPPDTLIVHTPEQDKTDLEKGIEYLISRDIPAVNILWATGQRSDHYLNNIGILARYHKKLDMVMLDDHSRIYAIDSGFKKHKNKGENFSLMPLNEVKNLTTTNLEWNLTNADLAFPYSTSSSNRVYETDFISVTFDSGFLLAMECNDID